MDWILLCIFFLCKSTFITMLWKEMLRTYFEGIYVFIYLICILSNLHFYIKQIYLCLERKNAYKNVIFLCNLKKWLKMFCRTLFCCYLRHKLKQLLQISLVHLEFIFTHSFLKTPSTMIHMKCSSKRRRKEVHFTLTMCPFLPQSQQMTILVNLSRAESG